MPYFKRDDFRYSTRTNNKTTRNNRLPQKESQAVSEQKHESRQIYFEHVRQAIPR